MSERPVSATRAAADIVVYTVARLLLVAVLGVVIFGVGRLVGVSDFPPLVALMFGFLIAMPLGIWVFAPLRRRAAASVAAVSERRRRDREQLRARLRGD